MTNVGMLSLVGGEGATTSAQRGWRKLPSVEARSACPNPKPTSAANSLPFKQKEYKEAITMRWILLGVALLLIFVPVKAYHMEDGLDGIESESLQHELGSSPYDIKRTPSRFSVYRRGCIPRGGSCTNRPHNCCFNSSCRCNLWGNNCRCQRMGLFQKWG